jgi:hypothetical protein
MRNTVIIILFAMCIIAIIYTMTNTTPAPPQLPPPLAVTLPYLPPQIVLPPSTGNLTNMSLHLD